MVLATVRHTGSHFAFSLFEQHFDRHYLWTEPSGNPFWFGHCEGEYVEKLRDKCKDLPLVLTMRHPMKVAESWTHRGKKKDQFFRQAWADLFALQAEFNGLWLPVDSEDRNQRLERIEKVLGVEFNTDWTPINVTTEIRGEDDGMSITECKDFYAQFDFAQFGYSL